MSCSVFLTYHKSVTSVKLSSFDFMNLEILSLFYPRFWSPWSVCFTFKKATRKWLLHIKPIVRTGRGKEWDIYKRNLNWSYLNVVYIAQPKDLMTCICLCVELLIIPVFDGYNSIPDSYWLPDLKHWCVFIFPLLLWCLHTFLCMAWCKESHMIWLETFPIVWTMPAKHWCASCEFAWCYTMRVVVLQLLMAFLTFLCGQVPWLPCCQVGSPPPICMDNIFIYCWHFQDWAVAARLKWKWA